MNDRIEPGTARPDRAPDYPPRVRGRRPLGEALGTAVGVFALCSVFSATLAMFV